MMVREKLAASDGPLFTSLAQDLDLHVSVDTISNVPILVISPPVLKNDSAVAIYIHGGAFLIGSADDLTALYMAAKLGVRVISLSYDLSPKAKFPRALNQLYDAYAAITAIHPAAKTLVIGESAGGNLALTMLLKARDNQLPMPVAVGLFTPWTDLSGVGDSYKANGHRDPILAWNGQLNKAVKAYVNDRPLIDPYLSPVYADYSKGFPPTIITTGTRDLFLSDCVRLYWSMKYANVSVELRIWEGMWHAFQSERGLPEGEKCLEEVAQFLNGHLR